MNINPKEQNHTQIWQLQLFVKYCLITFVTMDVSTVNMFVALWSLLL